MAQEHVWHDIEKDRFRLSSQETNASLGTRAKNIIQTVITRHEHVTGDQTLRTSFRLSSQETNTSLGTRLQEHHSDCHHKKRTRHWGPDSKNIIQTVITRNEHVTGDQTLKTSFRLSSQEMNTSLGTRL